MANHKSVYFCKMLQRLRKYLSQNNLFLDDKGIIVTVSGGIDSMVLMHLMGELKIRIAIAHCNFGLRGDESNLDEEFVRRSAEKLGLPFFSKQFDTTSFAKQTNLSIQEAARNLRYSWFEELIKEHKYEYYATAHNLDDRIETFFINAVRGSGISGLRSIKAIYGNCLRPLLFAARADIETYANNNCIPFREDSSNLKDDYTRNKIRHHLIPSLDKIDPHFRIGLQNTLNILSETEKFIQYEIGEKLGSYLSKNDGITRISIDKIFSRPDSRFILFELLKIYGFSASKIEDVFVSLNSESPSGKRFLSINYELIIDRSHLLIQPVNINESNEEQMIDQEICEISEPLKICFERIPLEKDFMINADDSVAQIDFNKLKFPLKLRKPIAGDYFYPIGLGRRKLVSDFFMDKKMSLFDKRKAWILESDGKIVWIIGQRLDERFKITPHTKLIFICRLI